METYMFERKMDNCKPCGGAIPLCMVRHGTSLCPPRTRTPSGREGSSWLGRQGRRRCQAPKQRRVEIQRALHYDV